MPIFKVNIAKIFCFVHREKQESANTPSLLSGASCQSSHAPSELADKVSQTIRTGTQSQSIKVKVRVSQTISRVPRDREYKWTRNAYPSNVQMYPKCIQNVPKLLAKWRDREHKWTQKCRSVQCAQVQTAKLKFQLSSTYTCTDIRVILHFGEGQIQLCGLLVFLVGKVVNLSHLFGLCPKSVTPPPPPHRCHLILTKQAL